jgi:hypothetical protein
MRFSKIAMALVVAAPLLALESTPAAAFGWCDWGLGYSSYGYTAPQTYVAPRRRYAYLGYTPGYYGSSYYGRRWGWRGYGYRGWRGYGYRAGWRGYRGGWRGARVVGYRGGVRAGRR